MSNDEEHRRADVGESARGSRQQPSGEPRSADHISEAFAQALGALIDASGRLPVCDRSAKLFAALTQLAEAGDAATACAAARRLVLASSLALDEDPWVRFHRAASQANATLCPVA